MAQTASKKPASKTTKNADPRESIKTRYQQYVLLKGTRPPSVFQFMHENKWKESTFYEFYGSFDALEKEIWTDYFRMTLSALHADAAYSNFSAREKMLAFYYTLVEVLRNNRSFVHYCYEHQRRADIRPNFLSGFRAKYIEWVQQLLETGKETDEIIERPIISDRYKDGLWLQLLFVLRFWSKDNSNRFEKTDAAIEKAVNLSFELMGRGPLDQIVDFAKFLYHNRM